MANRPAKRQRRSTILVSDDDDDDEFGSAHLPLRTQRADTKAKSSTKDNLSSKTAQPTKKASSTSKKSLSAKSSPTSSPQKTRKDSKQAFGVQSNKSLHNFFNKATEEQRWQRRADTPQQESQEDLVSDDIVDDDDFDVVLATLSQQQASQSKGPPLLKPAVSNRLDGLKSATPSSSQKFTRSTGSPSLLDPVPVVTERSSPADFTPWADRFGPTTIEELAVHKKKIADVQKWLDDVCAGRASQRVLVLKGPAGSGKSTTISMVSQLLGIQVIAWRNPAVSDTSAVSSIQQFADFLDRGGHFEALSIGSQAAESKQTSHSNRQLLLVEELPVTMSRSFNALDTFRSILLQHIARLSALSTGRQALPPKTCQPLVLVVSETLLTSSTALSDSFTAHRILGPELSHHPLVTVIEFNPIAPTFISKAIDLVIKKEARESGRRRIPGPAVLQQLAEVGDVRSAINSLEFICARGDQASAFSGTVAAKPKKSSKNNIPLTDAEKDTLQLISQRESTLDMFHATGKVVYNKREDPRVLDSRAEPPPKPPDHLMHLYTPKVSQVDVDALLNETGTDIQTFISTIHENYVLSCNGENFVDTLDDCSRHLSDSDYLDPVSRSLIRAKGSSRLFSSNIQSGNFDMLRQDEISFQVACRGLLFSLPFPINRAIPNGTRKQDAFKMFYPASLRLWKPAEETHDLVSLYAAGRLGEDKVASLNERHNGVASWKSRSRAFGGWSEQDDLQSHDQTLSRSFVSRDELVTEFLPYLALIRAAREEDVYLLNKITQFRGLRITGDELLDEEQYEGAGTLSAAARLQQKVEEAHNLLQVRTTRDRSTMGTRQSSDQDNGSSDAVAHEKLYISDDDIEDD